MSECALYALDPNLDDPKFEGFGFANHESLRGRSCLLSDFGPEDIAAQGRQWRVAPLAPFWIPQPVEGRVRPFNDYPCVGLMIPAFSRRAVEALRDLLEPNGELLPLVSDVGEYYAYNITTVADILDHERSEIIWSPEQRIVASEISRYECFPERLGGLSIFLVVEKPVTPLVTQPFVDRVTEHGLQGFHFTRLWPLPPGVDWRDADRVDSRNESRFETPDGMVPMKGNTVVVLLPLGKNKPNKAEKARLAKLMDELDALLCDSSQDARFYGNLEGHDCHEGAARLFLTCPDADALAEKLRPWLKRLFQEGPVRVVKRYGEFADPDCREEDVTL